MAALLRKEVALRLSFYTLGNDAQTEALRQRTMVRAMAASLGSVSTSRTK